MLKRFPVHITSHTSVQAIEDLRREHGYHRAPRSSAIDIAGNQKMATVNNIPAPADLMMAQYSLPFCVALAHYRNARDPAVVQRQIVQRSGDPRAGGAGDDLGGRRGQARPHHRRRPSP